MFSELKIRKTHLKVREGSVRPEVKKAPVRWLFKTNSKRYRSRDTTPLGKATAYYGYGRS